MVDGFAIDERVRASGVVADCTAHVRSAARCQVEWVHQTVRLKVVVQIIDYDSRLDSRPLFLDIDLNNLIHVLGHVNDDCLAYSLTCEACSSATW